jgi:hypothetical protein
MVSYLTSVAKANACPPKLTLGLGVVEDRLLRKELGGSGGLLHLAYNSEKTLNLG